MSAVRLAGGILLAAAAVGAALSLAPREPAAVRAWRWWRWLRDEPREAAEPTASQPVAAVHDRTADDADLHHGW